MLVQKASLFVQGRFPKESRKMTVKEREIKRRKKTEDRKAELGAGFAMVLVVLFVYVMIGLKLFAFL